MKKKREIKNEIIKKEMEVNEISHQINFGRWNGLDINKVQLKQLLCAEISALEWVLNEDKNVRPKEGE